MSSKPGQISFASGTPSPSVSGSHRSLGGLPAGGFPVKEPSQKMFIVLSLLITPLFCRLS